MLQLRQHRRQSRGPRDLLYVVEIGHVADRRSMNSVHTPLNRPLVPDPVSHLPLLYLEVNILDVPCLLDKVGETCKLRTSLVG